MIYLFPMDQKEGRCVFMLDMAGRLGPESVFHALIKEGFVFDYHMFCFSTICHSCRNKIYFKWP